MHTRSASLLVLGCALSCTPLERPELSGIDALGKHGDAGLDASRSSDGAVVVRGDAMIDTRDASHADDAGDAAVISSCTNDCTTSAAARCEAGLVSTCSPGSDGCLHWQSSASCGSGQCDGSGQGCAECPVGCSTSGVLECNGGSARQCSAGTDGCLSWKTVSNCDDGDACTTGDQCSGTTCSGTPDTTDTDKDGIPDCRDSCPNETCTGAERTCTNGSLSQCMAGAGGCKALVTTSCSDGCFDGTRCASKTTVVPASGSTMAPIDVAIASDGTVWVAGQTTQNNQDFFLRKLSNDGKILWTRTLGSTKADIFYDMTLTADDRVVLVGQTFGALAPGSSETNDAFAMLFPAQVDASSAPTWIRQVAPAGADIDIFDAVTVRADGKVVAAGRSMLPGSDNGNNGFQGLVVAFEASNGATAWSRQWGTQPAISLEGAAADNNDVYVGGTYRFSDSTMTTPFIAQLDAQGNVAWESRLPLGASAGLGYAQSVAAYGGHVYVTYVLGQQSFLTATSATHTKQFDQTIDSIGTPAVSVGRDGSILWSTGDGLVRLFSDPSGVRRLPPQGGAQSMRAAYASQPSELLVALIGGGVVFLRPAP